MDKASESSRATPNEWPAQQISTKISKSLNHRDLGVSKSGKRLLQDNAGGYKRRKDVVELSKVDTASVKISRINLESDTRDTKVVKDKGSFNKGHFTTAERDKVEKAIGKYLEEMNIDVCDVPYLSRRQTNRIGSNDRPFSDPKFANFKKFVYQESAINRTFMQIVWFIRDAYPIFEKSKFDNDDDRILLNLVTLKGAGSWTEIQNEMGRSGCKERFDCLQSQKKGSWSTDETDRMISIGKELMIRDGISDPLKFKNWTEVSALLGDRTYREVARHWSILGPRFELTRQWTTDDNLDLLRRMRDNFAHANDECEVIWKSISRSVDTWSSIVFKAKWEVIRTKFEEKKVISDYSFISI